MEVQKVETEEIVDNNFVSFHLHITTGKSNIQELLIVTFFMINHWQWKVSLSDK